MGRITGSTTFKCNLRLFLALLVVLLGFFVTAISRVPIINVPQSEVTVFSVELEIKCSVVLVAVTGNISEAIEIVREEQSQIRAECDAFDTFIRQVEDLPVTQESSGIGEPQTSIERSIHESDRLQAIRELYQETVMNVSHYDEEYDDSIIKSMTEEVGQEVVIQIFSGHSFTPLLKQQLLQSTHQCRDVREKFISTLETEREALETTQTTLKDIAECVERRALESSLDDLSTTCEWLDNAEQQCQTIIDERQQQRTSGHTAMNSHKATNFDLQTYLYNSLPVTYPVLADTAKLLEKLYSIRRKIMRVL